MTKLTIKSWALDDRPREKLASKGKNSLSDAELLAILIGSGNKEKNAVDLSKQILLSTENNINQLAKLSVEQLMEFKGIGEAKAITIVTALELGKRRHFEQLLERPMITRSKDVFSLLQPLIGELTHEEFWVLFLNNANKVLAKTQLSRGGLTATIVDLRLLFKRAIELSAVAIVICHNHPSGKQTPSNHDIQLTSKIKEAGELLDIKLLDHLIITQKTYYSFADRGKL